MMRASGIFEITSWEEDTYEGSKGGRRLARADVSQRFTGSIQGSGSTQWLMFYADDSTARFVGMQTIDGSLDGRRGSFVVESLGEFDGARASGRWSVVEGSGAGELAGIDGKGSFSAPLGSHARFELDYVLSQGSRLSV